MKGVLSTFFALFFYFQLNGQSLPVKIYNAEENAPIHFVQDEYRADNIHLKL